MTISSRKFEVSFNGTPVWDGVSKIAEGKGVGAEILTEVPLNRDKVGNIIHHVEEISCEQERRGIGGVTSVCRYLLDNNSPAQGVDERSVILGVPANTDVDLSAPAGEGGHEIKEGHLNQSRVLADCAFQYSV